MKGEKCHTVHHLQRTANLDGKAQKMLILLVVVCVCGHNEGLLQTERQKLFLHNHEENNKRNSCLTEQDGNAIKLLFGTLDKTAYTHTVISVPLHALS